MSRRMLKLWVIALWGIAGTGLATSAPAPDTVAEAVPELGELAAEKLSLARRYAEKKDCQTALRALDRVLHSNKSSGYDRAMAWSIAGYCHFELKQPDKAVAAYYRVLGEAEIPQSMRDSTRYQIAQLYLATEQWDEAVQVLEAWIASQTEPNLNAYTLLGQAYYQKKDYERARPALEKAVALARANGGKARENLYLLLRAIHYNAKDFPSLLEVMKLLVSDYPKKDYWLQLAAVYGELGQPRSQLAAMEAAYLQGLLMQSSEHVTLARLFLSNGIPLRAARVLEEGFEQGRVEKNSANLRLLADAYVMARDYGSAVAALQLAADREGDGETHLRLAQIYMETAQWDKVVETAEKAVKKGGLRRPDIAHIVTGLALYELHRLEEASAAFARAAEDERSRAMAQHWQNYIRQEQQRIASLKALSQG